VFYEVLLLVTFLFFGLYLTWVDLRLALLSYVLLIPFAHKELFSFTLWDLLPVRVLFLGILATLTYKLTRYIRKRGARRAYQVIRKFFTDDILEVLLTLLIVRIASIYFSTSLKSSMFLLSFYTSVVILFMVLKYTYEKYGYPTIKYLLRVYVTVGLVTGIFSFIQLYIYRSIGQLLPGVWALVTREGSFVRVGSIFWDINHYGAYIASILPIVAAYTFIAKKRKAQIIWGGGFIFGFVTLMLTQSRSAWGAFGLSMLITVFLLIVKRQFKRGIPLYIGGVVLLIGVVVASLKFGAPILHRLDTITDIRNNDSIKTHAYLLTASYEMLEKNPLLGSGYGSFSSALRETDIAPLYFFLVPSEDEIKVPAHSIWGEVVGETGGLGILVYTLLMYTILKLGAQAIKYSKGEKLLLSIALFSSICGLLAAGVLYSYNLEFFWFVIFVGALIFREGRLAPLEPESP